MTGPPFEVRDRDRAARLRIAERTFTATQGREHQSRSVVDGSTLKRPESFAIQIVASAGLIGDLGVALLASAVVQHLPGTVGTAA
jgi:hypothetical protein